MGFAPGWYSDALSALRHPAVRKCALFPGLFVLLICGCKSAPTSLEPKAIPTSAAAFPPRPTVPPPAIKLFHQDNDTYTLTTKPDATDDEISAILYELRDAAHQRTFDSLHLSQAFVDARKPTIWFHVYRGPKCAGEKFTKGKLPCDASYHGAGDYTLGAYGNPAWEDGVLRHADGTETKLWDPDSPTNK